MTGIEQVPGSRFTVYPVPNNGRFTFKMTMKSTSKINVSVFNTPGSKINEERDAEVIGMMQKVIDLKPVVQGVYTVIIENSEERIITKITVK